MDVDLLASSAYMLSPITERSPDFLLHDGSSEGSFFEGFELQLRQRAARLLLTDINHMLTAFMADVICAAAGTLTSSTNLR